MRNSRRNRGFTLAELLITVAIILILLGVAFVGVQSYQRAMTRLEFDSIAKEIYVAAQNHLTSSDSQAYLQNVQYGNAGTLGEDKNAENEVIVWFTLNRDEASEKMLDLMLPQYALDASVLSGSFLIRYQPSSASVLDVFYSRPGRATFLTLSGTTFSVGDYGTLMGDLSGGTNYRDGGERNRERYKGGREVIGWYGGGETVERGDRLNAPTLEVINAEQLLVKVTDVNKKEYASIKLIIVGKKSGAEKVLPIMKDGSKVISDRVSQNDTNNTLYSVVLDDITATDKELHFYDLKADTGNFIPGEDIELRAVAYSNTRLTNPALSPEGLYITNSLFADPGTVTVEGSNVENGIAGIANIRHLENLDPSVSKLSPDGLSIKPFSAKQLTDLDWKDFKDKTGKENTVIQYGNDGKTGAGCFYPVSPAYSTTNSFSYDGQGHKVSNVKVNIAGPAGLFGTLIADSEIKNLELVDFEITATGTNNNAGALIGTASGTTITNVLAHNSAANDENFDNNDETEDKKPNVTGTSSAGGLIGSMTGGSVTKSAAAVYVNSSSGSAGGLIGSASATTVSASYSGGHTFSGDPDYSNLPAGVTQPILARNPYPARYYDSENKPIYNVTGGTTAGGLIGSMTGGSATNCYSTCSATGEIAGGFVGISTGSISNSYCTGLVKGTGTESVTTDGKTKSMPKDGAFAYSVGTVSDCQYFEIINERQNVDEKDSTKILPGYHYLTALGGGGTNAQITPFDGNTTSYNNFSGAPGAWKDAHPYDSGLTRNYQNKYNLKTVAQLGATVDANTDFVAAHYGDWPAPEEFIFNQN